MDDSLIEYEMKRIYGYVPGGTARQQFKKNPPQKIVFGGDDLKAVRGVNTIGGWKRQSITAKVRDGKLPPEYLTEYADLTDSPAAEEDD